MWLTASTASLIVIAHLVTRIAPAKNTKTTPTAKNTKTMRPKSKYRNIGKKLKYGLRQMLHQPRYLMYAVNRITKARQVNRVKTLQQSSSTLNRDTGGFTTGGDDTPKIYQLKITDGKTVVTETSLDWAKTFFPAYTEYKDTLIGEVTGCKFYANVLAKVADGVKTVKVGNHDLKQHSVPDIDKTYIAIYYCTDTKTNIILYEHDPINTYTTNNSSDPTPTYVISV